MISVIIPTCDRPNDFLCEAINSVRLQSLRACEVIVVDNGLKRTDAKQLPKDIILCTLPPRVGVSHARNRGANLAKGSHLAFLDDDDLWDLNFLKEAWAVIEKAKFRCVYGRIDKMKNGKIDSFILPVVENLTIPTLLNGNPGTGGINILIEKKLFMQVGGFDEKLRVSEDRSLPIEILRAGVKIGVAPNANAIVRSHDGPRLRRNHFARLSFIWKYRHFFGFTEVCRRVIVVLVKGGKHWVFNGFNFKHKSRKI